MDFGFLLRSFSSTSILQMPLELVYTVHHCWQALFEESLLRWESARYVSRRKVQHCRDLPSSYILKEKKQQYALFRVEALDLESGNHRSTHASSKVFEYLDPKDATYREAPSSLPPTMLIAWDATANDEDVLNKIEQFINSYGNGVGSIDMATIPPDVRKISKRSRLLLKAALGAGGFGLYFISNAKDCLDVIQGHRDFANKQDGFIDRLRRDYGEVPKWSLQALVHPVQVLYDGELRKSQVRAYACAVNDKVFLYNLHEVRLPIWAKATASESDDHASTRVKDMEVENELCGTSNAIPYNQGRLKVETMRLMLSECKELSTADRDIHACAKRFIESCAGLHSRLQTMRKTGDFVANINPSENWTHSSMGILGIDLIVSYKDSSRTAFDVFVLEANCNPALPQPSKHLMSEAYRSHICKLCENMVNLGLADAAETSDAGRFSFTLCDTPPLKCPG